MRSPPKALLLLGSAALGVVIGYVLGGIEPRARLAERDRDVVALERELADANPSRWRSPVPGLDRILREPTDVESGDERGDDGDERAARGDDDDDDESVGPDAGVGEMRWQRRWRDRDEDAEERLEGFRRMASIQNARRAQSLAALTEQANLEDSERADVEQALGEMNDELHGLGEELLFIAFEQEPPPARDLLGVTHDVTGILHRAQLRLEEIVGPERMRDVDPTALEIWNHVDLARLEPAARAAAQRLR